MESFIIAEKAQHNIKIRSPEKKLMFLSLFLSHF